LPTGNEPNYAWTQTIRDTLIRMGLMNNDNVNQDEAIPDLLDENGANTSNNGGNNNDASPNEQADSNNSSNSAEPNSSSN